MRSKERRTSRPFRTLRATIRTMIPLLCSVRASVIPWQSIIPPRDENRRTKRLAFECQGLARSGTDFVILLGSCDFHYPVSLLVPWSKMTLDLGPELNPLTKRSKKFYRFSQRRTTPIHPFITKQYLDAVFCLAVLLSRSYVLVMSQNNSIPF